jgi:putative addiction module component (TIGR02574 family)
MSRAGDDLALDRMSVREKLDLIERIWDSLPDEVAPEDVPESHRELLARRLAEADASLGTGVPWREALANLKDRL